MVFGQEKLIADDELEDFLNALGYFWDCGYGAKRIAKEMHFGEPEPEGFPNLKARHVYYFVQRFGESWGMEPRRKQKKEAPKGISYSKDMPVDAVKYLKVKGLLFESDLNKI